MKTALLIGATGLIGSELLNILLESEEYGKVIVFARREIELNNAKLEQHVIDFNKVLSYKEYIRGDDFFCCIGTTIKKAKTRQNFIRVDFIYPSLFAEIAKDNGVSRFLLISSIGANAKSGNYYLRTKGLMERKIRELEFSAAFIFRPSFLSGERQELRLGEKVGGFVLSLFSVFLIGKLKKYRPIKAQKVAEGMCKAAQSDRKTTYIYESDEIALI